MRLSTADHEVLIGNALAYYRAYKESVSMRRVYPDFWCEQNGIPESLKRKGSPPEAWAKGGVFPPRANVVLS
jgi:hypothetical protein